METATCAICDGKLWALLELRPPSNVGWYSGFEPDRGAFTSLPCARCQPEQAQAQMVSLAKAEYSQRSRVKGAHAYADALAADAGYWRRLPRWAQRIGRRVARS